MHPVFRPRRRPPRQVRALLFCTVTMLLVSGFLFLRVPSSVVIGLISWATFSVCRDHGEIVELSTRLLDLTTELEEVRSERDALLERSHC